MVFVLFLISILSGQLFGSEAHSEQTTLYFVRHGQTDWNIQKKLQGYTDIPLNNTGRAEAALLREKISEIDFEACFSSDLQRAIETAHILNTTRSLSIKTDLALRERDFGPWEGRLFPELLECEAQGHPLNIESDEEILKRVFPLLHKIAGDYAGSTILIVTHGGVMRSLLAHLLSDVDCSSILSIQMKNMAILQLVVSNGQFEIQGMKDIQIHGADG